jgi:hypothetical protein
MGRKDKNTMGVLLGEVKLAGWVQKEVELKAPLKKGMRGQAVKRVQEWLNFQGYGLVIDGDFGRVTEKRVQQFQEEHGVGIDGVVDEATFQELIAPLLQVLTPIKADGHTLPTMILEYARAHLAQHPLEVGGQNCGPWVRLYMKGNEGADFPWCAGFVTFILKQAGETLNMPAPIQGSPSCDSLAAQGKAAGLFIKDSELTRRNKTVDKLSPASIFLVRRTSTDWTHTGFATAFDGESFETIEGNTNDEGSREGFEICSRSRGYHKKDFILL